MKFFDESAWINVSTAMLWVCGPLFIFVGTLLLLGGIEMIWTAFNRGH